MKVPTVDDLVALVDIRRGQIIADRKILEDEEEWLKTLALDITTTSLCEEERIRYSKLIARGA